MGLKNAKEIPLVGLDGERKKRRDPPKRKRGESKPPPFCSLCKKERRFKYNRVHRDAFGNNLEACLEHLVNHEQGKLI